MLKYFLITLLFLVSLEASAGKSNTKDKFANYTDPDLSTLTDYVFDSGAVKLENYPDVVGYLQFKDCTLYQLAKNDIFVQQQMMQQISEGQVERQKQFNRNLYIKVPAEIAITKYNFMTQSFDIFPQFQMQNVGTMVISDVKGYLCDEKGVVASQKFPSTHVLKLNYPASLYRLPVQSSTAKGFYGSMYAHTRMKHLKSLYLYIYISIEGVLPKIVRQKSGNSITLLGQMDGIDIYTDPERTKRIKRLDYSAAY
jgi:hypothetical protein